MRKKLFELIPCGAENAILQADLCRLLNLSPAAVKGHITALRRSGCYICSGQNGYYRPSNREELLRYVKTMQRQAISRLVTIKPDRRALREMQGQRSLNISLSEAMHGKEEKE